MATGAASRLRRLSESGGTAGARRVLQRVHLTPTGGVTLALVAAGWIAARLIGSRAAYLMVYGSLLAVLMAWFSSRRRPQLDVVRSELPRRMRVGQVCTVEVTVTTTRRVSSVMLHENLPEGLGRTVTIPITALRNGEELVHRYAFKPSLRGVYQLGPLSAVWSDPFGMTARALTLVPAADVIVHPEVEAVHDRVLTRMWEDPPVRPPEFKPWPTGFEFYGMRDYVPGDDLRRVVWSVMAKTGKLMVRESEQGITDRVVIVVANHAEWHTPGRPSATFETAVRTAASVGAKHLDDGFAVTLITSDGLQQSHLRGPTARLTYLDELARMQLSTAPLIDISHELMREARARAHFLLITTHLNARGAAQLRLIMNRGVSLVVAFVLSDESDPGSLARAGALGCQVVQIPPGAPLSAVFARQMRVGVRR